jgi:L-arabinose transport system substrate-binding protein
MKLVLSGLFCAGALLGATVALAADPPHFFYVVKDGNDLWFLDEVAGAKAEAEKLGAKFTSQNVELDANLAITGVDNAIAGGGDGLVVVVPEQQIGPAVIKKAKDAGIPIIAVDDGIVDEAGKPAPFVGFSSVEAGKQVGNAIADMYAAAGWPKPGPETAIITAEAQTVSVCMDRTENTIAVLKERLGMTEDQVIHLAVPDSQDNAMTTASQAIVAYPNVKKWLIGACNDNGVLGVVRALEQAGYTADDMIGVGVNGQIACEEFKKPEVTGFKGSIYVDSKIHGATAIRELYDHVTNGVPIPERTIIAGTLITKTDNEISCGKM